MMHFNHLNNQLRQTLLTTQYKVQSPLPIALSSMLATLATAMQDFLMVKHPVSSIKTPTSLYLLVLADSGERKTSTDNLLNQAIHDYDKSMKANDSQLNIEYQKYFDTWKFKHSEIKKAFAQAIRSNNSFKKDEMEEELQLSLLNSPTKPLTNRRIFSDSTIEALLFELSKTRTGGFFSSSEAGNILSKSNTSFTSALNTLWDGDTINITRKSSENFSLENKALTCSFMLQPDIFNQTMKTKEILTRGSGLWARFLPCIPTSTQGTRFTKPEFKNYYLDDFNNRVTELLHISSQYKEMSQKVTLQFDYQASNLWVQYADGIERQLYVDGSLHDIKDFGSKLMNNISRIAALLHFYDFGDQYSQKSISPLIGVASLEAAIEIGHYYTIQFKQIFGDKAPGQEEYELGQLLYQYFVKNFKGTLIFEKRFLYQNGPKKLRNKKALDTAIYQMICQGYLAYILNTKPIQLTLTQKFIWDNNFQIMYWPN